MAPSSVRTRSRCSPTSASRAASPRTPASCAPTPAPRRPWASSSRPARRDVPVWSLDDNLRYVRRHLTHVFSTGRKQVFQLTTSSGKTVRATANHPFLTFDGFRPLGELAPGDRIAVPRHVPAPDRMTVWEDEKVTLLAHLIGDGSFVKRQPLRYASIDEANLRAVTTAALHFGVVAVRDEYPAARCTTLRLRAPFPLTHGKRNPIAAWLDELGPVRAAQPREVRARAGVLPAQEADRACSCATCGPPTVPSR